MDMNAIIKHLIKRKIIAAISILLPDLAKVNHLS